MAFPAWAAEVAEVLEAVAAEAVVLEVVVGEAAVAAGARQSMGRREVK